MRTSCPPVAGIATPPNNAETLTLMTAAGDINVSLSRDRLTVFIQAGEQVIEVPVYAARWIGNALYTAAGRV